MEDESEYPNVYAWQWPILRRFSNLLMSKTNGEPAQLLNLIQGQQGARLMQTDPSVYLLAFAVRAQVSLLEDLVNRDIIHTHVWSERLRYWDVVRGTVVAQTCVHCKNERKIRLLDLQNEEQE